MKSIRKELTFRLLAGTAALLVVASGILGVVVHSRIVGEFDRALEAKALALVALTSRERDQIEVDYEDEEMPEVEGAAEPEQFQVLFEDGTLIASSEDFEDFELAGELPKEDGMRFGNTELPEEERGRFVMIRFLPRFDLEDELNQEVDSDEPIDPDLFEIPDSHKPEESRIVIIVARNRDQLDQLLIFLYGTLIALDSLLLLGIFYVAKKSIQKGLEPINALNAQIAEIGPEALEARIALDSPPQELHTILNALNGLLQKVQEAFARERRFSSAVAHELRTPVSELRMACETGQMWPEDEESVKRLFKDNHDIALHMERIVTNLLELTRCDNKTAIVNLEEFQLDALIRECWRRSSDVAQTRELSLKDQVDPEARVISDLAKLEIILQNLIDNAIAYSVSGSVVVFSSLDQDGRFCLIVENETDNLVKGDLERVFERFWRKDPARSAGTHAGLGLALVKALADLLSIEIAVDLVEDRYFRIQLVFGETDSEPSAEEP